MFDFEFNREHQGPWEGHRPGDWPTFGPWSRWGPREHYGPDPRDHCGREPRRHFGPPPPRDHFGPGSREHHCRRDPGEHFRPPGPRHHCGPPSPRERGPLFCWGFGPRGHPFGPPPTGMRRHHHGHGSDFGLPRDFPRHFGCGCRGFGERRHEPRAEDCERCRREDCNRCNREDCDRCRKESTERCRNEGDRCTDNRENNATIFLRGVVIERDNRPKSI